MTSTEAAALFEAMVARWPHIVSDSERERWTEYFAQQPAELGRAAFEILSDADEQRFMPQLSTFQDAAREVRRSRAAHPASRESYAETARSAIASIRERMGWAS